MTNTMKICPAAILLCLLCAGGCHGPAPVHHDAQLPHIVYILADDMGYGDIRAYNADSKIPTPWLDSLARQGMRFTDAHSASSVCTPSRYALLTGRYAWRGHLKKSVLDGYGRALIEPGRPTVATLLQGFGYRTAVIGKWHLGLNWVQRPGKTLPPGAFRAHMDPADLNLTRPVEDGPREHGFDYSYILPASLDMPPYCYVRNDSLETPPLEHTPGHNVRPPGSPDYAIGAFWRAGAMAEGFDFSDVLSRFTREAVAYIRGQANASQPFFLYFPMPAPHTPWLPRAGDSGRSGAGAYGDYVTRTDAVVGEILRALRESGLEDNTLVIFASDNGPYWRPAMIKRYGHRAAGPLRGMKADVWEGGHRVPFIVRWPGQVRAGSVSGVTTTLTDLMATCSALAGGPGSIQEATDSYNLLPAFNGEPVRAHPVVHHSSQGMFAIRDGDWIYVEGLGSGGFSPPVKGVPAPGGPLGQLYHLSADQAEAHNLFLEEPARVAVLQARLDSIRGLTQATP